MSRLTDLIAQTKARDPQMGADLEREFKALSSRRSFGLNFEKHRPETVELPNCQLRKGDKVRILSPRGESKKGDQRLWQVKGIKNYSKEWIATLIELYAEEPETCEIKVDDLVVVTEFRDKIFPGLVSTGKVERGKDKPFHTVINGENFHALKALTYTHRGKVDTIYIDPPYNTGARDWKYNNDYVEGEDLYRHSKWLAFMERRLKLVKELLNLDNSVLIVTIDEKEYLRLGLLLEQIFPGAHVQMVSSVINPKGTGRTNYFSRTDEYIYFVFIGNAYVPETSSNDGAKEVRWKYLRRTDVESARGTKKGGPSQFYPIYVNLKTNKIEKIGKHLSHDQSRTEIEKVEGCVAVLPIREKDNKEMNWGLTGPSLQKTLDKGFVRVSKKDDSDLQPYVFSYLTHPNIKKVTDGKLTISGERDDGSLIVIDPTGKKSRPTTTWNNNSHEAGAYGTSLLGALIPNRKFPFPKSLYAVQDTLELIVRDNKQAIILDFFSGSGTTAHAVMRLNHLDGGSRQSISITNNEVSAEEQRSLRERNLRPGDADWEKWGICEYITKPRIKAAITGETPEGNLIEGEYKFNDEFPISNGFSENVEFFTLSYESPISISHNLAFERIASLLWLRAGSFGKRISQLPINGWDLVEAYGVLIDLDKSNEFSQAINISETSKIAYIVTNDDRRFQAVARQMPDSIEPVRLYESYLNNFQFANGE